MIVVLFHAHMTFAIQLIALAVGALVYAKGKSKNIKLVTAVGIIVMALATLSIIATLYYGYTYWSMMQNAQTMMQAHTVVAHPAMAAAS